MKKFVFITIVVFVGIMQIAAIVLHSNGIAGYTDAPGEATCTDCHNSYPLNTLGGSVSITAPTALNNNYICGQTYTVAVKITRAGTYLFGFDFEALDSTGASAGTLTLLNNSTTVLSSALVGSNNRANVMHYGGVFGTDSCTFLFKWTAPLTNVGKVTFYAAGNASNGDGFVDGDYIYTNLKVLNANTTSVIADTKNEDAKFSVFPNPVEGSASILYMLNEPTTVTAKLLSLTGQVLTTFFSEQENTGLHQKKININPAIKKGVYFLELELNNKPYLKKIEVQ